MFINLTAPQIYPETLCGLNYLFIKLFKPALPTAASTRTNTSVRTIF